MTNGSATLIEFAAHGTPYRCAASASRTKREHRVRRGTKGEQKKPMLSVTYGSVPIAKPLILNDSFIHFSAFYFILGVDGLPLFIVWYL
jgi:hypothetical protein